MKKLTLFRNNYLERIIEDLKDKLAKTEARAEETESKYKNITRKQKGAFKTSWRVSEQKGFTLEKLASLEKHLRESDLQLELAEAAVEASDRGSSFILTILVIISVQLSAFIC